VVFFQGGGGLTKFRLGRERIGKLNAKYRKLL
jgi:hypothetical protein